jgi:hypothetical protein
MNALYFAFGERDNRAALAPRYQVGRFETLGDSAQAGGRFRMCPGAMLEKKRVGIEECHAAKLAIDVAQPGFSVPGAFGLSRSRFKPRSRSLLQPVSDTETNRVSARSKILCIVALLEWEV